MKPGSRPSAKFGGRVRDLEWLCCSFPTVKHAQRSCASVPSASRSLPKSDPCVALFASPLLHELLLVQGTATPSPKCARNKSLKQDQAKNWQDRESTRHPSLHSIAIADMPFLQAPRELKADPVGEHRESPESEHPCTKDHINDTFPWFNRHNQSRAGYARYRSCSRFPD
jgi:hypothetical protein